MKPKIPVSTSLEPSIPGDSLVTFRAGILSPELGQRVNRDAGGVGFTAKADLSRFYVLLRIGREAIARRMSSDEMNMIAAGVVEERQPRLFDKGFSGYDAARMQKPVLIARIRNAVSQHPIERVHGVDAEQIVAKIQQMNDLEVAALVDTIERLWSLRPKATAENYADELDFITSDYTGRSFGEFIRLVHAYVVAEDPSLEYALNDPTEDLKHPEIFDGDYVSWSSLSGLVSVGYFDDSLRIMALPTVPDSMMEEKVRKGKSASQSSHRFEYWLRGTTRRNAVAIAEDIVRHLNGRRVTTGT